MGPRSVVVGCGELIYDHVFLQSARSLIYHGSRGGGSVFNLLANVAHWGGNARAIGVAGCDALGDAARDELRLLGVETAQIISLAGRRTRIIFETLVTGDNFQPWKEYHTFGAECLVCGSKPTKAWEERIARFSGELTISSETDSDTRFVCFDKLTQARTRAALKCIGSKVTTVVDLGRLGYLRYFPAAQVVAALAAFQIVFMPTAVARSLSNRLGIDVCDVFRVGPRRLMLISEGPAGVSVYDNRNPRSPFTLPGVSHARVVDEAGAGDTFLARTVWGIARRSREGDLSDLSPDQIEAILTDAIGSLEKTLMSYGARGHITPEAEGISPIPRSWRGLPVGEIRQLITREEPCPFCGMKQVPSRSLKHQPSSKPGAKVYVNLLLGRVLFALERKDAIEQCRTLLQAKGTAYAIGTGGSFTVATFVSNVLNTKTDIFTQPIRPFDYIRLGRKTDYVFVVTYSGSTEDCAEAVAHAKELGACHIVLMTGVADPRLRSTLRGDDDILISLGRESRERGFVSIAATVAPCALWVAANAGIPEMASLAARIAASANWGKIDAISSALGKQIHEGGRLAVFGGGLAWPGMIDLESKFVEGGIGTVQLHEVKDFSHGRFISLLNEPENEKTPVLLLSVGPQTRYENYLLSKIEGERRVECLSSDADGIVGSLELLIWLQYLAQRFGAEVGKDISRPDAIPPTGLSLYHWNGGLK